MSKINIDNELCNYIDANDGQVTLGGLAEHFAEYGYQYAVDKACEWLSIIDVNEYLKIVPGFGYVIEDEDAIKGFRKAMEE